MELTPFIQSKRSSGRLQCSVMPSSDPTRLNRMQLRHREVGLIPPSGPAKADEKEAKLSAQTLAYSTSRYKLILPSSAVSSRRMSSRRCAIEKPRVLPFLLDETLAFCFVSIPTSPRLRRTSRSAGAARPGMR